MRMITFVAPLLACAAASADPAVADAQDSTCTPRVTRRTTINRTLPHALYDQAMESLRAMHPDRRVLAARRVSRIGQVEYTLLAYQRTPTDSVRIVALAVHWESNAGWDLDVACAEPGWTQGLLSVMEALAALPRGVLPGGGPLPTEPAANTPHALSRKPADDSPVGRRDSRAYPWQPPDSVGVSAPGLKKKAAVACLLHMAPAVPTSLVTRTECV
jgi:hypothetical protein